MAWDDGLTGPAHAIAATDNSPIRVMAGPGTGKSFALKRRLTRLLESAVDPSRLLVVTFTRTAAADLVREIADLGVDGCEDIVASTLHSYCFRLLMKEAVFEFTGRIPRPLVTFTSAGVLQFEAAPLLVDLNSPDKFGDKRARTRRIRAFEALWARLQHEDPGWAADAVDTEFEEVLKAWLDFHQCMLIGELIPESLNFLRNNPASPARDAFDHVLVDEYQDLNKAEQVLIDLLAENGKQGIVGDQDQSIYSFRHAHPEGIVQFAGAHPGTDDHILDECRRCPKLVVAMADQLIRRNHPAGTPARLNPRAANPNGDVQIVQWDTLDDEAAGVAAFVIDLVENHNFDPGNILILSPRRLIGYGIRDALVDADIPTHSFYQEEALEEDEAQEAFSLLSLLANPQDRVALRFWLGFGSNTWLTAQYALIRQHCESSGEPPWDAMGRLACGDLVIVKTSNIRNRFLELQDRLNALTGIIGPELVDALFPEGESWAQVLREASLLACDDGEAGSPTALLDYLRTRITQPEMPEHGEFVRVMSLHKSKGLTSRAVIVCGCIEGLIPFRKDDAPQVQQTAIIQEQRRLFYVAITRCTEVLVLSSFRRLPRKLAYKIGAKVTGKGAVAPAISSRFLSELGPTAPVPIHGDNIAYGA